MKPETFEVAQQIQQRIYFLRMTKQYLSALFEGKSFGIKVEMEFFGQKAIVPIHHDVSSFKEIHKEDAEAVYNSITYRIADLQKQFDDLK
jgi:hypothetical protein